MISRLLSVLAVAGVFTVSAFAGERPKPPPPAVPAMAPTPGAMPGDPPPIPAANDDSPKAPASTSSASSVPGLDLPADQSVNYDEGFVNLQAQCKGEVKWLIVSGVKTKYVTVPQTNAIIVSIPPQGGVINVFAVGLVDGKLTDFARTNISVGPSPCPNPSPAPNPAPGPGPGPGPSPGPGPGPIPANVKLHVTFFIDMDNPTAGLAKLMNSETLRKGINEKGYWFRLYDIKSPLVAQKKLDQVVQRVGGSAVMVVQSDDGRVLGARAIPGTEGEILSVISQITGR